MALNYGVKMATFGVNKTDGTIAICKAKPQNRGKGRCPHGDHVEREGADASDAAVNLYNEEKLKEYFNGDMFSFRSIKSAHGSLTKEEFAQATQDLSEGFTEADWRLFQTFYADFEGLVEQEEKLSHARSQVVSRLVHYLESDDEVARSVRKYLGPEVDPHTFASILVNEVKSMTAAAEFRNSKRRDGIGRIVATSVVNDMNKKRYVASVLYFAGKCCYCGVVMSKEPREPNQATGEHITPISPEDPSKPMGATRYGNMVLACLSCNSNRGNQDLEEWMKKTKTVAEDKKAASLEKISQFRKFALYEDFSMEKTRLIQATVSRLKAKESAIPRITHGPNPFDQEAYREFKQQAKATMFDLAQKLKD